MLLFLEALAEREKLYHECEQTFAYTGTGFNKYLLFLFSLYCLHFKKTTTTLTLLKLKATTTFGYKKK